MIKHTTLIKYLTSTAMIATSGIAFSPSVVAQTAEQASAVNKDEVVVTARRRDESIQDVPVAVTTMTGVEMEAQGAINIAYLNQVVPNVTVETSRSTNSTLTTFIRGVGQQDPVAGFEQGVGLYIDDVYINRPQAALLDVFDVERVEVLRGPQGTLYGRNTVGGAIKYVTKRLDDEAHFSVKGALGSYFQRDLVATANAPVSEGFRLGASAALLKRDGFGENLVQTGVENYNKDVFAGRISAEFDVGENLQFRVAGDLTRDTSDPRNGHRLVDSQFNRNPDGSPVYPVLDNVFDTRADLNYPEMKFVNKGVSWVTDLTLSETVSFKNIMAYRKNTGSQQIDFDSLPVEDLQSPYLTADNQFSNEFLVNYNSDAINGTVGLYYLKANATNEFDVLLGQLGALISLPRLNAYTAGEVETDTWSVFGDFSFDLGELAGMSDFELSVGGRYTEDNRKGTVLRQTWLGNSTNFGTGGILLATTSNFTGQRSDTDFSPRVSLAYKGLEDHNVYVSYAEGFKGGGFDPRGQSTATPDFDNSGTVTDDEIFLFMTFEPEEVTTYEAGVKSTWMDGRATTNLAVFYSDYKNVQIPGSIPIPNGFAGATTNAGKAPIWGVEFEGNANLTENWLKDGDSVDINWGVGYINAKYDEFIVAVTTGGTTALTNVADFVDVQNTPDWSLNIGGSYTMPVDFYGLGGALTLSDSLSYRSATQQFEFASPIDQKGYALYDANIVWTAEDGKWSIGLHGRNLFNKEYKVAGYDFFSGQTNVPGISTPSLGLDGTLTAFYGDPRTVTATIKHNFF